MPTTTCINGSRRSRTSERGLALKPRDKDAQDLLTRARLSLERKTGSEKDSLAANGARGEAEEFTGISEPPGLIAGDIKTRER